MSDFPSQIETNTTSLNRRENIAIKGVCQTHRDRSIHRESLIKKYLDKLNTLG